MLFQNNLPLLKQIVNRIGNQWYKLLIILLIYNTNTAPMIKRIKYTSFQKRKPIVYIPKITRVQQGTAFSADWFKYDITDCLSRKTNSSICCRGRIEIKYLLLCLLQNNLLGVEVLFEIQKTLANALAFLFQTTFLHLEVILQQTW